MKTLPQLIARTDAFRIQNAKYVKLTQMQSGRNAEGFAYIASRARSTKVVTHQGKLMPLANSPTYLTAIMFLDSKLNCKVTCSCPDFMFMWEVALNNKGAADIDYSNGAAPIMKNPRMVPGVCKHTVALYQRILPQLIAAQAKNKAKG